MYVKRQRTIKTILFFVGTVWFAGSAMAQTRPTTRPVTPRVQPTATTGDKAEDGKKEKDVKGGTGVVPAGGDSKLAFDPKKLGQPDLTPGAKPIAGESTGDVAPNPADEIISFKSNNLAEAKCVKQPLTKKLTRFGK